MKETTPPLSPPPSPLSDRTTALLRAYLLGMADDELLLGHRDSEWCGHAPILEEDIAFANLALDEIGHAAIWYNLIAGLAGEDRERYPDQLVYWRDPGEFRNIQLVELPKGDWAFSILRQYLFDAAELVHLEALEKSIYTPLSEASAKIRREEIYHHRHSLAWVKRLSQGTEESNRRMQAALDVLWAYTRQLFASQPGEVELVSAGLIPAGTKLAPAWEERVKSVLDEGGLVIPDLPGEEPVPTRGEHTPHLAVLLAEMQSVARLEEVGSW